MKDVWCLRLTVLCFATIIASKAIAQQNPSPLPKDLRSLMIRVASERESIVQYAVDVSITEKRRKKGDAEWLSDPNIPELKMYIEYSKINDHLVVATMNSPTFPKMKNSWFIGGKSNDVFIKGMSNSKIYVSQLQDDMQVVTETPEFFDPKTIGLLICWNWTSGFTTQFEGSVRTYTSPDEFFDKGLLYRNEDGLIVFESDIPSYRKTVFHIDDRRDYWPVYTIIERNDCYRCKARADYWKAKSVVSLTEKDGKFVPSLVQMFCEHEQNDTTKENFYLVNLDWHSVNREMACGKEAAERFAKRFNCDVVDLRRN